MCIWEIVEGVLAVVGAWQVISWPMQKSWPNLQSWVATLNDSPIPIRGKEAISWRTEKLQEVGGSFVLDIRKVKGKARLIDRIRFTQSGYSASEIPEQVAVTIQGENAIYLEYDRRLIDLEFGHNIDITFQSPLKVKAIALEITKPRTNTYWAVGDIRIREVRLFGRLWKVDIR